MEGVDYSKLFRGVYINVIIAFDLGVFGRGCLVKGFEGLKFQGRNDYSLSEDSRDRCWKYIGDT